MATTAAPDGERRKITPLKQLSDEERRFLKMIDPGKREPDPVAYSVNEAARALCVRPGFIRARIADKSLSALRIDGKRWRIRREALDSFLRSRPTR